MPDLTPFRNAAELTWVRHTVFAPHRGDDGTLVADDGHRIPLDTYSPDTLIGGQVRPPMSDNVGIAVVDPVTLEDVHNAIRAWCRIQLGRDDICFG